MEVGVEVQLPEDQAAKRPPAHFYYPRIHQSHFHKFPLTHLRDRMSVV